MVLLAAMHSVAQDGSDEGMEPVEVRDPALWDAYLRNDEEARLWLDGDALQSVLEKDDQWQKKSRDLIADS